MKAHRAVVVLQIVLLATLALALAALVAARVRAEGEASTTWRPGDRVVYETGCHSHEAMAAAARAWQANDPGFGHADCFATRRPLPAVLIERVSGPYARGATVGSIWRVEDIIGDTEFILLDDRSGPHAVGAVVGLEDRRTQ